MGESPTVLTLADQLTGELQQRQAIGDVTDSSGNTAKTNSIIVKLPVFADDDVSIFAETKGWLERHAPIIGPANARKILEFQTFLDSDIGSRILTVPNSVVRICADLGMDIANQAIRVPTKTEYEAIRGNKS